jgi:hypothetical protein
VANLNRELSAKLLVTATRNAETAARR